MKEQATLGEVLDRLRQMGDEIEEVMDYSSIKPDEYQHRTVVFVRLPHPKVVEQYDDVQERLHRFLTSLNRPDTIKADIYTLVGKEVLEGFQPFTKLEAHGDVNLDEIHAILEKPYVLQVVIDVVKPEALDATLDALKKE